MSYPRSKSKRRRLTSIRLLSIIFIIFILIAIPLLAIPGIQPIRLDFAGGSHRITPTAIDNDIWGNYRVYYRTSNYTREADEGSYYVLKGNHSVADQIRNAISDKKDIMVYYEKYVGIKSIGAPPTAPITKVEILN